MAIWQACPEVLHIAFLVDINEEIMIGIIEQVYYILKLFRIFMSMIKKSCFSMFILIIMFL